VSPPSPFKVFVGTQWTPWTLYFPFSLLLLSSFLLFSLFFLFLASDAPPLVGGGGIFGLYLIGRRGLFLESVLFIIGIDVAVPFVPVEVFLFSVLLIFFTFFTFSLEVTTLTMADQRMVFYYFSFIGDFSGNSLNVLLESVRPSLVLSPPLPLEWRNKRVSLVCPFFLLLTHTYLCFRGKFSHFLSHFLSERFVLLRSLSFALKFFHCFL